MATRSFPHVSLPSTLRRAAVLLGALTALGLAAPAGAVIENPDIDTDGEYVFTADPETGVVSVRADIAVTADKPDSRNYYYYFTGVGVVVPAEAENLVVTNSDGRELSFEADTAYEGYQLLDVSFGYNLRYRRTAHVIVSYDLPGGQARAGDWARVNDAYIGFPVVIDPTLEAASVRVDVPAGFEDQTLFGFTESEDEVDAADGRTLLVDDVSDPEYYFRFMSLTNDDALVTTTVEVDDASFELRSWPGDDAWVDHVETSLTEGLDTLVDTVGLDWPLDEELVVIESFTPYLSGYGGWYDPETHEIEIGDELDQQLVFHELSHVWLNSDLFEDRWITEGLAEFVAAEAVEATGEDRPEPDRASPNDEHSQTLNSWSRAGYELPEVESWSYLASWTVTEELVEEIGVDAMRNVIAAVAAGETAYPGDGDPEVSDEVADWRVYLDHLQAQDGVDDEAIEEIFLEWIVTSTDERTLERRNETRVRFDELTDAGGAWAAPLGVRNAMAGWDLNFAGTLMDDADAVLADRDELIELLEPTGSGLPDDLEAAYEDAERLDDVAVRMEEATETAEALVATDAELAEATGLLEQVGAIGSDVDATLAEAIDAYESGDDEAALDLAAEVDEEVDQLADRGRNRLLAAGAALLASVGLLVVVLRRGRRRAGPDPVVEHGPDALDDVPGAEASSGDVADAEALPVENPSSV